VNHSAARSASSRPSESPELCECHPVLADQWILFRTHVDADTNSNIAIIHPDGTGFRQLTHFTGRVNMRSATFSPDGRWVVLASDQR
jgi:WD40-like Beta Propeller Repeat